MMKRTKKKKVLQDVNEELIEFIPELEYDEEKEQYLYTTFIEKSRVIFVNLNEIFDRDDLGEHSVFKIQDRKYYNPVIMNLICLDMNEMLNNYDNDYPRQFTNITMKIAVADSELDLNKGKIMYTEEEFKKDILKLIENIKDDIFDYVDRVYNPILKESKKKINVDLQVTESMDKAYIASGIASRLVIPLINNYMTYNLDTQILIASLFKDIILYLSNNDDGPFNKIIRIIESRVSNTKYIHKVMWDKMFNILSMDPELKKLELFFKIIEGILPKLEPWTSSIQFLDSVIKNQLEFLFAANFGTEHKCNRGDLSNTDNDDNSNDKMESLFIRNKSEDKYCLELFTIQQTISNIIKEFEITQEDFDEFDKEYFNGRNVNKIQELFIKNYNGSIFDIKVASNTDKKYLLYELIVNMQDLGFKTLPNILLSTISKELSNKNKKKLRFNSKYSKEYNKLMKNYQDVLEFIQSNNFIYEAFEMIRSVNFIDLETNEIVNYNDDALFIEIIKFFEMLKKRT